MRISTLGWGVLAYLLVLSPGLLANEDPVCQELREEMTADELGSPRGLMAKAVCPSLHTESDPLDTINKIKSLNHDDLLSLCSTELRQLGYLIYKKHHIAVSETKGIYEWNRAVLYLEYHLSPKVQANGLPFTDGQYEKFKALPKGHLPVAPIYENQNNGYNLNGFFYSSLHFVQPTTGLPEDAVRSQWIDPQQLSGKELLDFSPTIFLSRHNRPLEAFDLIGELSARSKDVDFVVAFNHALGVVAETYHMYFASFNDNPWLSENLYIAMENVFRPIMYFDILSTRNEEAITTLLTLLDIFGILKRELQNIYYESTRVPGFEKEMITGPARGLGTTTGWPSWELAHLDTLSSYEGSNFTHAGTIFNHMVAKFIGPSVHYANVTFDSDIGINGVSSQMG